MKKLLFALLFLFPVCLYADLLDDLVSNKFAAQLLTSSQADSILNPQSSESAPRYQLKYRNKQQIFRRSFWADYYLLDTKKNIEIPLSDQPVRDAQMSPDGKYVVYAKGNNLYIYKVDFNTEVAITSDGEQIFNGVSDWLYEEEFTVTRMFEFSPDSKQVAFVRLDETQVPTFVWQEFLGKKYPTERSLRYPKAGEKNAIASVCVYDIHYKSVKTMQLGLDNEAYVPRIRWTKLTDSKNAESSSSLLILTLNRDQNRMEVVSANPKSTVCTPLYKEQSNRYFVDYELFDQWQWLSDNRFIVLSEKEGWRRAYLYSAQGTPIKCLTPVSRDITRIYGLDESTGMLYYQAAPTPATRQCYAVNIKSVKHTELTYGAGTHNLTFSKDYRRFIDDFQSVDMPNCYTLYDIKADKIKKVRVVKDNKELLERWDALQLPRTEFIRIPTERGDTLDAYTILPVDATQSGKRYPVVMLQYSGPASQRVLNRWRKRWGTYLAQQGYIVVNADPRGTDCRGREWRNETYMRLGAKEAEDHISVARYLQTLPYVDGDRLSMCGWSYGGYQTLRTMCCPESPFRCGMAIAPVTDWKLYDSAYTERYMRRPQVNESGYDIASVLNKASQLKGRLLLVHGTADDNVHAQNTLLFADKLVEAGIQFDMQMYLDDNHSIRREKNNIHLHRLLVRFLENNLR